MLIAGPISGTSISADEPIVIGLINNMPDAALRATEGQFRSLLAAASLNRAIRIRRFTLPGQPRSPESLSYIEQHYEPLDDLWLGGIDGLIVTGTEPRAARLSDEPYWPAFTRLIEWADRHIVSTIWSCLAAHAAVLHLDGIERRRLPAKLSGVYTCATIGQHPVVTNVPAIWSVPHSRYNDLPEESLIARGYQLLSRSITAGANLFIKRRTGLEIFFQGHPEYELDSLLREYRRDVSRFLNGERSDYPAMPADYFPLDAADTFADFRERALLKRDPGMITSFPSRAISEQMSNPWRAGAIRIYENWLEYLTKHKDEYRHEFDPASAKIAVPSIG
jgi:homoserine O-succinyltransferase/O-acetyltransferase